MLLTLNAFDRSFVCHCGFIPPDPSPPPSSPKTLLFSIDSHTRWIIYYLIIFFVVFR